MFDRQALAAAFGAIGAAALANGTRLELAVYGGAAMMLASNFRFATEDVDIASLGAPWPDWLTAIVETIAERNGWAEDWLNDAVTYLFKRWTPEAAPGWIGDRGRYLDLPWFPNAGEDPALMEYLTYASPAEFKSRNVMVDDEPLRRANMPRR